MAHNLLSSEHTDTTAATVQRGDLVTGQGATPTWSRLAKGNAGTFVRSDGTDVAWERPWKVLDALAYGSAGDDVFKRIEAAYNSGDLDVMGGIIDARGATGSNTITSSITLGAGPNSSSSKPVLILLPPGQYEFTSEGATPRIRIRASGITLRGSGVGTSGVYNAYSAMGTMLFANYSANQPLVEVSPEAGDTVCPTDVVIENLELRGAANSAKNGPAVVFRASQSCTLRDFHVTYFSRTSVPAVQIVGGTLNNARVGSYYNVVEDGRIDHCAGGVEIAGYGDNDSDRDDWIASSNRNVVSNVRAGSLSGPAVRIRNYAVANAVQDLAVEAGTGDYDVQITGIADGTRIERLYTEPGSLTGQKVSVYIGSDSSERHSDQTALGDGVSQNVSIFHSTISGVSGVTGISVAAGHRTLVDDVYFKGLSTGIAVAAGCNDTQVGQNTAALVTTFLSNSGTRTAHHVQTHMLWDSDNAVDIGASGANRPRDLHVGRDAVIGGQIGVNAGSPQSRISVNANGASTWDVCIYGQGSTSGSYSIVNRDSAGADLFYVRNDGLVWNKNLHVAGTVYLEDPGADTGTPMVRDSTRKYLKPESSSRRYKENERPWKDDPEALMRLEPKVFDYKGGTKDVVGFVAEDLEAAGAWDLLNRDADGRPDSVRVQSLLAYLVAAVQRHERALRVERTEG